MASLNTTKHMFDADDNKASDGLKWGLMAGLFVVSLVAGNLPIFVSDFSINNSRFDMS